DRVDLFRETGEGVDDLLKLGRSYLGLELIHDDVTEDFIGRGSVGGSHGNNQGKWNEGTKKTAQARGHNVNPSKQRGRRISDRLSLGMGKRRKLMILDSPRR